MRLRERNCLGFDPPFDRDQIRGHPTRLAFDGFNKMPFAKKGRIMGSRKLTFVGIAVGSLALAGPTALLPVVNACAQQSVVSYSEDIAPIFRGWCVSCHQPGGEGYQASRLDLTTYRGVMAGTKFGPMIVPHDPDDSNLIVLIEGRASPEIRMPFGHKPLPNCLRQEIWTWIFQGAKDN